MTTQLERPPYPAIDPGLLPDPGPPPDAILQEPHLVDSVVALRTRLAPFPGPPGQTTIVSSNTFIYYNPDNLNDRVGPDCYVSFNVNADAIRAQNGYLLWVAGKAPDFVLEIASPSTASRACNEKRQLYARIGVSEYWRFDPTGGEHYGEALIGEYLEDGEYRRFPLSPAGGPMVRGYSPALALDLVAEDGRLFFEDPTTGERLRNPEAAEAEIARLTAELRRLREA